LLRTDGKIDQAQCAGFNPYYQPLRSKKKYQEALVPVVTENVTKIFLWNGVSSKKKSGFSSGDVPRIFPKAEVEIEWDLVAAARAYWS